MFKCDLCKKVSAPGDKPVLRVVETRRQEYTNTVRFLDEYDVPRTKTVNSVGHETVKEVKLCAVCDNEGA